MKCLLFLITLLFSLSSFAQDIFVLQKSKRIKNVLHFKGQVENCKLKDKPVSTYWVMGEEDGHTEGLSSSEKPYFTPNFSYTSDTEATFVLGALGKLSKVRSKEITVRLEKCKPVAYMELAGREIKLKEFFVQVNALMYPTAVTIRGWGPDGSPVETRFE